jgi:tripartite-type tricarboxylate transporter receptor subunit TctC
VLARLVVALAAAAAIAPALAQEAFPARAVRLIVPWPAGGSSDIVARLVAERLAREYRQPVVVENRAGASGKIGSEAAARAPADGYTIVLANSISHASITLTDPKLGYDPQKDFAPISLATQTPMILAVHPSVAARSVAELVSAARAKPGALNFASAGPGSAQHLMGEWFRSAAGIEIVHIPYRGIAPAHADLLAGVTHMIVDPSITPYLREGRLRGLATTGPQRSPLAPDLPTLVELGYRDMTLVGWNGFAAPAGTPAAAIDRHHKAIVAALADPEIAKKLFDTGLLATSSTPERMREQIANDLRSYRRIVVENRLKLVE